MLSLENISGGYNAGSQVLQGISMHIAEGESVGIIGLNGCGKSTLAKAIMNILPFRDGVVKLHDTDVSNYTPVRLHKAGISMVMQGGRIFQQMTIKEHLMLVSGTKSEQGLKNAIRDVENHFGFTIFADEWKSDRKGSYLSGGEKQKLAFMMALLHKPKLLILDEVSAGLSPLALQQTASFVSQIRAGRKTSLMIIEQNISLASQLCDRLLLLERGVIDQEFRIDENFSFEKLNESIFN